MEKINYNEARQMSQQLVRVLKVFESADMVLADAEMAEGAAILARQTIDKLQSEIAAAKTKLADLGADVASKDMSRREAAVALAAIQEECRAEEARFIERRNAMLNDQDQMLRAAKSKSESEIAKLMADAEASFRARKSAMDAILDDLQTRIDAEQARLDTIRSSFKDILASAARATGE